MDTTARDLGTFVQRRPSCWFITAAKRKQQWRWSWGKRQSVARTWLKMENCCAHFSCAENKAQTSSMPSSAEHPYQFDSRVILMSAGVCTPISLQMLVTTFWKTLHYLQCMVGMMLGIPHVWKRSLPPIVWSNIHLPEKGINLSIMDKVICFF